MYSECTAASVQAAFNVQCVLALSLSLFESRFTSDSRDPSTADTTTQQTTISDLYVLRPMSDTQQSISHSVALRCLRVLILGCLPDSPKPVSPKPDSPKLGLYWCFPDSPRPDSPKPVSPKPDSPKLGFRVRVKV